VLGISFAFSSVVVFAVVFTVGFAFSVVFVFITTGFTGDGLTTVDVSSGIVGDPTVRVICSRLTGLFGDGIFEPCHLTISGIPLIYTNVLHAICYLQLIRKPTVNVYT